MDVVEIALGYIVVLFLTRTSFLLHLYLDGESR